MEVEAGMLISQAKDPSVQAKTRQGKANKQHSTAPLNRPNVRSGNAGMGNGQWGMEMGMGGQAMLHGDLSGGVDGK